MEGVTWWDVKGLLKLECSLGGYVALMIVIYIGQALVTHDRRLITCFASAAAAAIALMSSFAFDFDLEDDLDESFDAITASPIDKTLVSKSVPGGATPAAEEIPLSTLVRDSDTFFFLTV